MEFAVVKNGRSVPLVSTHTSGPDDATALQIISADLLLYYQRLDKAMRVFLTQSQIDQIRNSESTGSVAHTGA